MNQAVSKIVKHAMKELSASNPDFGFTRQGQHNSDLEKSFQDALCNKLNELSSLYECNAFQHWNWCKEVAFVQRGGLSDSRFGY